MSIGAQVDYQDGWTVEQARDAYLAANGFSLADYGKRWVRLQVGPVPLYFPNSGSRRQAVPLHDLHHVATGYRTDWRGEAEISAWELGAGCGRFLAAWILDLGGAAIGMFIAPRRTWRAFRRGRRSRTLYRLGWSDDQLAMTVADLRHHLNVD